MSDSSVFSVFIAASLDGFIARTDGAIDWLASVNVAGEDYGFKAFFDTVDVLVLGRVTYDLVSTFEPWPYSGKRVVVLTNRPLTSTHGATAFRGSVVVLAEELKRDGAKRVYVDGGQVVSQFLEAGLVADLTLSIVPILIGSGIRLFSRPLQETKLVLKESRTFGSGLVQLRYSLPSPNSSGGV